MPSKTPLEFPISMGNLSFNYNSAQEITRRLDDWECLLGFMICEYDTNIFIVYSNGKRGFMSCISLNFKHMTNQRSFGGINFATMIHDRYHLEDVAKTDVQSNVMRNVLLLPLLMENIPNQRQ